MRFPHKKRPATLLLFALHQCIVLNETYLSVGRETGAEAADRILHAAILTELLHSSALIGVPVISDGTFFTDVIAGIERDKFYRTAEVDSCIQRIYARPFPDLFLGAPYIAFRCELKPDHWLIDKTDKKDFGL